MRALIFILFVWFGCNDVKAQFRFDEFSDIIKTDINEANQPDSFLVFINQMACTWGNEGDWTKLLVFLYREEGVWYYRATKIDKRDMWLIKSVSNPCSFPINVCGFVDSLFMESHRSIAAISKSKTGEHTGFYVSIMSKCAEEVFELPYYNAPGPGHMVGFANTEYGVFYNLFSLCLVGTSGFDYKIAYRKKIKRTTDLVRIKF